MFPLLSPDGLVGSLFYPEDGRGNADRHHDVAGPWGSPARCADPREHAGQRSSPRRSAGHRRRHGHRIDRGGVRDQLRRDVGSRSWPRSPVCRCRCKRMAHYYVVTEAIPGLARGLPTIKSSDDWMYVKNEGDGLMVGFFEPGSYPWQSHGIPGRRGIRPASRRLGASRTVLRDRHEANPSARHGRHPAVLRRSRELHPRRRLPLRRGPEPAELLHRRRLQLDRIPHRAGHRLGDGRLARRRTPVDRPARGRSGPRHAARDEPAVPRAARDRDARRRLRHALAVPPAAERSAVAAQPAVRSHGGERRRVR